MGKMTLTRSVLGIAALATALAAGPGGAAHKLNTTQMISLEKRFEQALFDNDAKEIAELMSDSATVVLAFSRPEPEKPLMPGPYATTAILSKGELVSRVLAAQRSPATRTISRADDGNRRFRVSENGFVVTVPATEFVPEGEVCAGACMAYGFQPDVYATVVWTRTSKGLRVTLFETSPIETALSNALPIQVLEKPISN